LVAVAADRPRLHSGLDNNAVHASIRAQRREIAYAKLAYSSRGVASARNHSRDDAGAPITLYPRTNSSRPMRLPPAG
jgi:hypothetical protein